MRDRIYRRRNNNVLAGLILLGVGAVWLIKQLGFFVPGWVFSWPMILIVVGLFIGARNNFRDFGWLIMVGVGGYFLVDKWWPDLPMRHYIWPVIIIGVGLFLILSPRRYRNWGTFSVNDWDERKWEQETDELHGTGTSATTATTVNPDDKSNVNVKPEHLDIVSIFAGFKKRVYSKNFIGGDVVCIFGGADIDLTQADFKGPVILDMVHIFGGSKLIIPPNWEVRTEAAVIFGGVDDKRRDSSIPYDKDKLIVIKGAIIFGGIEIKSY